MYIVIYFVCLKLVKLENTVKQKLKYPYNWPSEQISMNVLVYSIPGIFPFQLLEFFLLEFSRLFEIVVPFLRKNFKRNI